MNEERNREVIGHFYKDASKRVWLRSLTVLSETDVALTRREYDVDYSRRFGYIFNNTGHGGHSYVEVSGIYHVTANTITKRLLGETFEHLTAPKIVEKPPQWVGSTDAETAKICKRNRTRRLFRLPKAFDVAPGDDLLDWLQTNGIESERVWCSTCRDVFPGDNSINLCEHVWWCDKTCSYSTPNDRCKCKDHEECRDL